MHDDQSADPLNAPDSKAAARAGWPFRNLIAAWQGLQAAWRLERSFRNQAFGALAMFAVLLLLRPEPVWWGLCLFGSALLLALELVNSAIEHLIDHIDRRWQPEIKRIKDISAGAVIVASAGVLVLGVIMIVETLGLLG